MEEEKDIMPQAETEVRKKAPKRKKRKIFWVIMAIFPGLPLLLALLLFLVALFVRTDPALHMPGDFNAYISLPSASLFSQEALHLKAIDALLSGEELADAKASLRALRGNPFLRSRTFIKLADIRVDAAIYDDGFMLLADAGLRSAITRHAILILETFPFLLRKVPGLEVRQMGREKYILYSNGDLRLYLTVYRNLILASSTMDLLLKAQIPGDLLGDRALVKSLGSSGKSSLHILVNTEAFAGGFASSAATEDKGNPLEAILAELHFPSLSVIDLDIKDSRISLNAILPWTSQNPDIEELLGKRARTPSVLNRLPDSAEYFSLLCTLDTGSLWAVLENFLGKSVQSAFDTATSAAKIAFGMTIDRMLFSWMGDELGVFGSKYGPAPVFFASIKDEKARREIFEKAFDSILLDQDISAIVNGIRVPRISFPRWLGSLLDSLGIKLAEPYYLVDDGYIWLSSSAETLASCVEDARTGKVLARTEAWKNIQGSISPEASAMVYYNLDRAVPFFMRSNNGIAEALKLYRSGIAVFRTGKKGLELSLSAVNISSQKARELPGFPARTGSRMSSDPLLARADAPMAFWTSGKTILAMNLASGAIERAELDDRASIALQEKNGSFIALWAVSERGSIYSFNDSLENRDGFPVLSGLSVSGPIAIMDNLLLIPVSDENSIMLVDSEGNYRFSNPMFSRLRSAPFAAFGYFAALPRSFDSLLYLFDSDGQIVPGWPVELDGLASARPLIIRRGSEIFIAAITEAGQFSLWTVEGSMADGFPVNLYGTFTASPAWAQGLQSWFLVSADGVLWRLAADGFILNSASLSMGASRDSMVMAIDTDQDGFEEIFVSGAGDALYAYGYDLGILDGYPVPGMGLPGFIDVDGDSYRDMLTRGADDSIHVFEGGPR